MVPPLPFLLLLSSRPVATRVEASRRERAIAPRKQAQLHVQVKARANLDRRRLALIYDCDLSHPFAIAESAPTNPRDAIRLLSMRAIDRADAREALARRTASTCRGKGAMRRRRKVTRKLVRSDSKLLSHSAFFCALGSYFFLRYGILTWPLCFLPVSARDPYFR